MASVEKRLRDGKTTWMARWREPDGRQRKKSFARRADAERYLTTVQASLLHGAYVDPSSGKITLGAWAEQWSQSLSHLKATTRNRYLGILRLHIVPRWGRVPLASVSHADVVTWISRLSDQLSPASVRYVHRIFSLLMELAVRDGRLSRNPAVGVPLPRIGRREPRFLSPSEVARLVDAAAESGLSLRVLALTGLRFGELAALRVGRIETVRGRLVVAESVTEIGGHLVWSTPNADFRTRGSTQASGELVAQRCGCPTRGRWCRWVGRLGVGRVSRRVG